MPMLPAQDLEYGEGKMSSYIVRIGWGGGGGYGGVSNHVRLPHTKRCRLIFLPVFFATQPSLTALLLFFFCGSTAKCDGS